MPTLPTDHIQESMKLTADAEIDLFELSPLSGGTLYFKSGPEMSWLGNLYEGLVCALSGEEVSLEKMPTPRLVIGQENLDLLPFKGLVFDRHLDGATLVRRRVLLANIHANQNVKHTTVFRVKRVEEYSRTKISLQLATHSGAAKQTIPFRQYLPPDFPWVDV